MNTTTRPEEDMADNQSDYAMALARYLLLRKLAPHRARLFRDDFDMGTESGPGTGGEWAEVALELERALAGRR